MRTLQAVSQRLARALPDVPILLNESLVRIVGRDFDVTVHPETQRAEVQIRAFFPRQFRGRWGGRPPEEEKEVSLISGAVHLCDQRFCQKRGAIRIKIDEEILALQRVKILRTPEPGTVGHVSIVFREGLPPIGTTKLDWEKACRQFECMYEEDLEKIASRCEPASCACVPPCRHDMRA